MIGSSENTESQRKGSVDQEAVAQETKTEPLHKLIVTVSGDIDLTPISSESDPPPKIQRNPNVQLMTPEERKAAKRKANAEAARRCRERKAQKMAHLDHEIELLETANSELSILNDKLEKQRSNWKKEESALAARNKELQTRLRQLLDSKTGTTNSADSPVNTTANSNVNR